MRPVLWLLAISIASSLVGCADPAGLGRAGGLEPGPPWHSEHFRSHPLAGRVWDVSKGKFTQADDMLSVLEKAPYILLGEKHDNVDHHRIQAWILGALLARGRRPAVAFEMFSSDQDDRLAEYFAVHGQDAAGLGAAVEWEKSGWPAWAVYQPIAQAALDGKAPILSANLPRRTIWEISRRGIGVLGEEKIQALGLDRPLPAQLSKPMREEIIESHCRQLPESMVDPLVTVQAMRDAYMASVMVRGREMVETDGALLIAGGGHVRNDRATPWHLKRAATGQRIAAVGLLEVADGVTDPNAYAARVNADALPFDFVWFTPRADIQDPCEKYADQLRRVHGDKQTKKKK